MLGGLPIPSAVPFKAARLMCNASVKELEGGKHDLIMQQYSSPLRIKACIFEEGLHAHLKSLLLGKTTDRARARAREREGVR